MHARDNQGHKMKGWRMVVGPGVVANAVIYGIVGVSGALGAELPNCPAFSMFLVEEGDEAVERVAVCALRVCLRRTGAEKGGKAWRLVRVQAQFRSKRPRRKMGDKRHDEAGCHVAEVQTSILMLDARSCDNLSQQRSHRPVGPKSRDVWR